MCNNLDDIQFMQQMARQLDETILQLAKRETELRAHMGPERVEEIRELWDQTLDRKDELELRRTLDWRDRELLWIWSLQRRAHSARAEVGQAFMRTGWGEQGSLT
jgi:hypothetical protein